MVVTTIFLKSRFFLKSGFLKSRFHCTLVLMSNLKFKYWMDSNGSIVQNCKTFVPIGFDHMWLNWLIFYTVNRNGISEMESFLYEIPQRAFNPQKISRWEHGSKWVFYHSSIFSCITFHVWKSIDSGVCFLNKVYRDIFRFL